MEIGISTILVDQYRIRCIWGIDVGEEGEDFIPDGSAVYLLLIYRPCESYEYWGHGIGEAWIFMVLKPLGGSRYERIGLSGGRTEYIHQPSSVNPGALESKLESVTEADYTIV
jgi:hypothetical protein